MNKSMMLKLIHESPNCDLGLQPAGGRNLHGFGLNQLLQCWLGRELENALGVLKEGQAVPAAMAAEVELSPIFENFEGSFWVTLAFQEVWRFLENLSLEMQPGFGEGLFDFRLAGLSGPGELRHLVGHVEGEGARGQKGPGHPAGLHGHNLKEG